MRAVDTSVLVRLITRDEPKQVAAAEFFVTGGAWVSHVVLAEALWVIESVYDRTPEQLATVVEMLLAHQHLTLQDPDVVTAALAVFRKQPSLGFSDPLILEIARKAGHVPLGTFDRRLSKLEGGQKI